MAGLYFSRNPLQTNDLRKLTHFTKIGVAFTHSIEYNDNMINNDTQAVRDAVNAGISVLLPGLVDDYTLTQEEGYTPQQAFHRVALGLAKRCEITAGEAETVTRYTLTKLGVSV